MKKLFFTILIFSSIIFSQEKSHLANDNLFSPTNIKRFADYLFCLKDYLRAANEYERILSLVQNDSIEFKIALSYLEMGNFSEASTRFNSIKKSSSFYKSAQAQSLKSVFQTGDIVQFRNQYLDINSNKAYLDSAGMASLYMFSFLLTEEPLPNEDEFIKTFPIAEKSKIKNFYDWKQDPLEKSPLKAAIFSAVIPGAGKIYANEYSDGIYAFIATLVAGYLAFDNFKAGHDFRGWIFCGLTAGFYAGNIYGSAAAVQIYNARIRFDFINELKAFLEDKNYFLQVFNFCN
ncbi:MAG: hypothetical protein ABR980_05045 [Ignavibacteriaceae bacterium]|jgi:tetratricopeptide (TPR) repeat protein